MAMLCKCPECGHILDARKSEFGEIDCPCCHEWCWIPRDVLDSAPFAKRTRAGYRIVDVTFDFKDGYVATYINPYGQPMTARSYDPFKGYWRGDQQGIDDSFSYRR